LETGAAEGLTDPEFEVVKAAWSGLPDAIRAGIVAMVKAAATPGK